MRDERLKLRRVASRFANKTRHAAFATWVSRTAEARREKALMRRVASKFANKILHAAYAAWRDAVADAKRLRALLTRVASRFANRALSSALSTWAWRVEDARRLRATGQKVIRRMVRATLSRAFATWQSHAARSLGAGGGRVQRESDEQRRERLMLRATRKMFARRAASALERAPPLAERTRRATMRRVAGKCATGCAGAVATRDAVCERKSARSRLARAVGRFRDRAKGRPRGATTRRVWVRSEAQKGGGGYSRTVAARSRPGRRRRGGWATRRRPETRRRSTREPHGFGRVRIWIVEDLRGFGLFASRRRATADRAKAASRRGSSAWTAARLAPCAPRWRAESPLAPCTPRSGGRHLDAGRPRRVLAKACGFEPRPLTGHVADRLEHRSGERGARARRGIPRRARGGRRREVSRSRS